MTIPPRGEWALPVELKPSSPGEFKNDISIFLDTGRLETHTIAVRGTAKCE